ncbi:zinc-binding dehydrogenase, partial [Klebsiella aerogenes]|uniref:zinc-binding dehydrogenase n=1 Tax=Klebsiella aerogenes TaxID=548 RepID=UPI0013D71BF3
ATGGAGANVILDMVGGDYIERNYEAAAVDGRIVQIAFLGSAKATVDFRRIMLKRLTHTGSTLRSRSVEDKAAIARAIEQTVL